MIYKSRVAGESDADRPRTPEVVFEALLGDAAESAKFGVAVYDDDGRIVATNRHAAESLGYDRHEFLSHDIADFTDGGIDRSVLDSSARREGVRLVRRKDGTRVPMQFVVVPTKVSNLPYYIAVSWELDPDDPRAAGAR